MVNLALLTLEEREKLAQKEDTPGDILARLSQDNHQVISMSGKLQLKT